LVFRYLVFDFVVSVTFCTGFAPPAWCQSPFDIFSTKKLKIIFIFSHANQLIQPIYNDLF